MLTGFASLSENATVTITNASPAVVTYTTHDLVPGASGQFSNSGGALPTGISAATTYYVCKDTNFTANAFDVSLTFANGACGALVNTSSAGSGTQTFTTNTAVQNPGSAVAVWGPSGLTGSQTTAAMTLNQVWNTSGAVLGALTVNVTNIASGATSYLMRLNAGSAGTTNEFEVDNFGNVTAASTVLSNAGAPGFSQANSTNQMNYSIFRNSNSGSSAAQQIEIGNNTSATEVTMLLNSSANTGGNGDNSFTINAAAGMWLAGGGDNAIAISNAGTITLYNQPTTGSITYGVCAASGANGTGGGALILDTSATVCGLSSMAFKKDIAAFDLRGMSRLASLDPVSDASNLAAVPAIVDPMEILKLSPAQFRGDGKTFAYTQPEFGIMAQDACDVDNRLCARFPDGTPRTPIPSSLMALQVGFDKAEDAKVAALTAEVAALRSQLAGMPVHASLH